MTPEQLAQLIETSNQKHFLIYDEFRRSFGEISRTLTQMQTEMSLRLGAVEAHLAKVNGRLVDLEKWRQELEVDRAVKMAEIQELVKANQEQSQARLKFKVDLRMGLILLGLSILGPGILTLILMGIRSYFT